MQKYDIIENGCDDVLNRLKQLRLERNLSMRDLALKVGINYTTFSALENEKRPFNLDHLTRLSQFFDCSFDYILGKSDERKPQSRPQFQELDSVQIALLAHTKDLSNEEKQQVMDFIEFIKSKKKGN